ncbi:hypothetical protein BDZ85DRAFT_306460 [Elsinoe ampelina]|uniref:Uncharacterized protein n=1 Tax=Elsinoe ampelina TaxID=302913 RepID=A0A6A6GNE7_9PEZI|nr:hypothetical protein BDZ85DRAFT_306460 [Elsinoe ampelina]
MQPHTSPRHHSPQWNSGPGRVRELQAKRPASAPPGTAFFHSSAWPGSRPRPSWNRSRRRAPPATARSTSVAASWADDTSSIFCRPPLLPVLGARPRSDRYEGAFKATPLGAGRTILVLFRFRSAASSYWAAGDRPAYHVFRWLGGDSSVEIQGIYPHLPPNRSSASITSQIAAAARFLVRSGRHLHVASSVPSWMVDAGLVCPEAGVATEIDGAACAVTCSSRVQQQRKTQSGPGLSVPGAFSPSDGCCHRGAPPDVVCASGKEYYGPSPTWHGMGDKAGSHYVPPYWVGLSNPCQDAHIAAGCPPPRPTMVAWSATPHRHIVEVPLASTIRAALDPSVSHPRAGRKRVATYWLTPPRTTDGWWPPQSCILGLWLVVACVCE